MDFFHVRSRDEVVRKQKKRKKKIEARNKASRDKGEPEDLQEVYAETPNDDYVWKQVSLALKCLQICWVIRVIGQVTRLCLSRFVGRSDQRNSLWPTTTMSLSCSTARKNRVWFSNWIYFDYYSRSSWKLVSHYLRGTSNWYSLLLFVLPGWNAPHYFEWRIEGKEFGYVHDSHL